MSKTRQLGGSIALLVAGFSLSYCGPPAPDPDQLVELLPAFTLATFSAENYLYNPADAAFSAEGELFIFDSGNHRVVVTTPDGDFLREFGGTGEGPGEFATGDAGDAIAVGHGYVATLERRRQRVSVFDQQGIYRATIVLVEAAGSVAISRSGVWIYTYGQLATNLKQFNFEGELLREINGANAARSGGEWNRYNSALLAAASDETIVQGFVYWPLFKLWREDDAPAAEFWLDFSWIDDAEWRQRYIPPKDWLDAPDLTSEEYPALRITMKDVAVNLATGDVALFLNGNIVQMVGTDGQRSRVYHLQAPPEGARGYAPGAIAISRDGRLCAVWGSESALVCYDLP